MNEAEEKGAQVSAPGESPLKVGCPDAPGGPGNLHNSFMLALPDPEDAVASRASAIANHSDFHRVTAAILIDQGRHTRLQEIDVRR
jgi:hypothetical protein